jgi:hypothetical protein
VALQRIAIPIVPGKFKLGMRSRSDPQNNVIFWIAPIHDPIRQKLGYFSDFVLEERVNHDITLSSERDEVDRMKRHAADTTHFLFDSIYSLD